MSKLFFFPVLALLFLSGCSGYQVRDAIPVDQVFGAYDVDPEYLVQVGDTVRVAFRTFEDPTNPEIVNVVVRPDGKAFFPLLDDEVLLAGYTPAAIRDALLTEYKKLIKNPSITVNIVNFGPRNIYVGGEIRDIRLEHTFNRGMTATRAIMMVGYDTYRGDLNNVIVVRQSENGKKPNIMQLRLKDALENRAPEQDIALRPNDIVFVPPKGMVQAGDVIRQIDGLIPFTGIIYPVGAAYAIDQMNIFPADNN